MSTKEQKNLADKVKGGLASAATAAKSQIDALKTKEGRDALKDKFVANIKAMPLKQKIIAGAISLLATLFLICLPFLFNSRSSTNDGLSDRSNEEQLLRPDFSSDAKGAHLKTGDMMTITLPGGATMVMIYVAPGSFIMGSDSKQTVHKVRLTKGFWLGKYEVTQMQWKSVMGDNPSEFKDDYRPVDKVSWNDCQRFIRKVNAKLEDGMVRLPTEAEWEYACRAGTTGDFGNELLQHNDEQLLGLPSTTSKILDEMGWYAANSGMETHPVGQKDANAWGFHDMYGNVQEWCSDWHGEHHREEVTDPLGPVSGEYRVLRGGDYGMGAPGCSSSSRGCLEPDAAFFGFRLGYDTRPDAINCNSKSRQETK